VAGGHSAGETHAQVDRTVAKSLTTTTQFYLSCAQISVSGGGGVNPSNTVSIPGAFKETDPGYTANVRTHYE
jgi:hypothetical protein